MPTIHHGDCIETMNAMPPESVDAIVTDPPYGLGFMGKKWDDLPPSLEWAEACYRVLKPGGHIAAFGGTRTWHRLAVAIEDAGFEMRDSLAWLYGSGFPKSHDVGKAIDKRGGNPGLAKEIAAAIRAARESRGWSATQADHHFCGGTTNWTWFEGRKGDCRPPTPATFTRIVSEWPELAPWAEKVAEAEREVVGKNKWTASANHFVPGEDHTQRVHTYLTAPATPEAAQWDGWGTALKPAFEPIVLARKPLAEKTVARNVLAYGTGAINIDATRIGAQQGDDLFRSRVSGFSDSPVYGKGVTGMREAPVAGRWPANVLLDQHAAAWVDEQSGEASYNSPGVHGISGTHEGFVYGSDASFRGEGRRVFGYGDRGGPSRFFYTAKAPKSERPNVDGVQHPTVKPLAIMRWLLRLVTPPGGTVLDPFAGSGTTIEAALIEGFDPVGIEMEADYLPLIQHRIDRQAGTLTA